MPARGGTFSNPILPGFHPDPSICVAEGRFYLVTSSFEYFPGIPLFVSDDLVTWVQLGHVLDRTSQLDLRGAPASGGLFAPTIRYHNGTWFVACTNVTGGGHFLVTSTDPASGWSDPIWIEQDGIDPSLFFEDGQVYFTSNVQPDPGGPHEQIPAFQRGIQQSLIDPRTGAILDGPHFIWAGTGARYPEAPHVIKRQGWYYLVIAEGGTEYGHIASVGRSSSPWGPFEPSPYGPMIDHRSIPSPFQAMGHADVVEASPDDWWAVCLGVRPLGGWPHHTLGRETFLAPLSWTDDGWPIVGDKGKVGEVLERPALPAGLPQASETRDGFEGDVFGPSWMSVRIPAREAGASIAGGAVVLRPEGRSLDGRFPCFVGRRQQHHAFRAATSVVAFEPVVGDEAGLAVRMNDTNFYSLGIRQTAQGAEIRLAQRFGHVNSDIVVGTLSDPGEVTVEVESDGWTYQFSCTDGRSHHVSPPLDAIFLSTEVAGGYTGIFVGMYATSVGPRSGAARFDWFEYAPRR